MAKIEVNKATVTGKREQAFTLSTNSRGQLERANRIQSVQWGNSIGTDRWR